MITLTTVRDTGLHCPASDEVLIVDVGASLGRCAKQTCDHVSQHSCWELRRALHTCLAICVPFFNTVMDFCLVGKRSCDSPRSFTQV